jgi:beta-lactamase class A
MLPHGSSFALRTTSVPAVAVNATGAPDGRGVLRDGLLRLGRLLLRGLGRFLRGFSGVGVFSGALSCARGHGKQRPASPSANAFLMFSSRMARRFIELIAESLRIRAMILAMLLAAAVAPLSPTPIEQELARKIAAFHGEMGLYARNLDTGETIGVNADYRFPTASLIKVAVMAEVFRQIGAGKIRKDQVVVLRDADKAGDETIPLNMLHDGTTLTVSDLLKFMIAYSDNTATNLLVGLVGTANVDALLDANGLTKTRLYRPTFRDGHADVLPDEEKEFGLGSTTPREAATLMALIAEGKLVSRAACDEMIGLLGTQQDRMMIPRGALRDRGDSRREQDRLTRRSGLTRRGSRATCATTPRS